MGSSASTLVGVALAMLLMVGRSGLDRFLPSVRATSLIEVRHIGMAILALGVLGVFITQRGRQGPAARSTGERVCLATAFLCQSWMLASAAWAPFDPATVDAAGDVLLVLVGFLLVTSAAKRGDVQRLTGGLVVGVVVAGGALGVIGVAAAIGDSPARLAVLGGGPNVYGRLMGVTAIALFATWLGGRGGLWLAGAAVLAGILTLLSGSRGAMAALLGAALALAALERRRVDRMAVGAAVIALVATTLIVATPLGDQVRSIYDLRVNALILEGVHTSGRDELYRVAITEGAAHPWGGHGLGAFAYDEFTYPHNVLLEAWHASGGIGAGLLVTCLVLVGGTVVRNSEGRSAALAALFVLFVVASQFSGNWYDSRGVFWLLPLVLMRRATALAQPTIGG